MISSFQENEIMCVGELSNFIFCRHFSASLDRISIQRTKNDVNPKRDKGDQSKSNVKFKLYRAFHMDFTLYCIK